ncbi:hypothetical protein PVNG_06424 [Plasmodium vivax North Korean]|uniref:Uncharacterized protein n=1 Tax=Plasmodium vivax North Korean TaxID=1035514 RepID=A0A0J9TP20_PLAVI|nr:hypothetical protein PVNG_06424 [Plasmodium vivax North Korean]
MNIYIFFPYYYILKHLTLCDFCEKLDNELDEEIEKTSEIENKCQYCQDYIANDAENGVKLINLCKKTCNIILTVYDILDKCSDKTGSEPCNYMGY